MLNLHDGFDMIKKKFIQRHSKSYCDMIIDSLIIASITFFSTWTGTIDINSLLIVLKATGLSFFVQLSYEKCIKKEK